ncbi:nucleoside deaminase [Nocardioidaceae bacterium]|nr:nucleoside deaminase [Nocardioidaceae bacterium]
MGEHLTRTDVRHLERCVQLAGKALEAGHDPFGSLLVDAYGTVLTEDHNRVGEGDQTLHPEIALARWAARHLDGPGRAAATVYTSGEHCPMCSAAHAWVGLGRIVFASSSAQLASWREEWGLAPGPVTPLATGQVAPGVAVAGPDSRLAAEVRSLHARNWGVEDADGAATG